MTIPTSRRGLTTRQYLGLAIALLVAQALILAAMGHVPICTCGTVKLWQGSVNSPESSQHLLDWYSPSHLIHGILFYGVLRLLLPRAPILLRLVLAMGIEVSWEILENTPAVIERYRSGTISLNYYGDSIVNSVFDTLAAALGFFLAARLPVVVSVLLVVGLEAWTAFWIRDNLTLNVLMLLYPIDAIREWQAAVPSR